MEETTSINFYKCKKSYADLKDLKIHEKRCQKKISRKFIIKKFLEFEEVEEKKNKGVVIEDEEENAKVVEEGVDDDDNDDDDEPKPVIPRFRKIGKDAWRKTEKEMRELSKKQKKKKNKRNK